MAAPKASAAAAPAVAPAAATSVLNVNVGVLGHVDCGKTSLVAALSTTLSTAALDKHPQSKERGITLDLGFSSFTVPPPPSLSPGCSELQFTLVDCPGHASLIRTIIGGAQIIDTMVLVIDVTKGLQAQTAECLVVGEIAAADLVVALNKIDQLPEAVRARAVKKASRLIREALAATNFAGAAIIPVSAKPEPLGIQELRDWLTASVERRQQQQGLLAAEQQQRPFLFAVDHCFPLKGQGTVLTGTVLQGCCRVNDTIELPALKLSRVVKSMQMFHKPVQAIARGDRAAVCVTQLNAKLMERGLAAAPGSVPTFSAAVAAVDKVRFFAGPVPGRARYHMSIGHATVMADASFFGLPDSCGISQADALKLVIEALNRTALHAPCQPFDFSQQYQHQEELFGLEGRPAAAAVAGAAGAAGGSEQQPHFGPQWALLRFEQPVTAPEDSVVIGARLDVESSGESCRLAFYGRLLAALGEGAPEQLRRLQVYKLKERHGVIERIAPDGCSAICKGLFKKETDMAIFEGARVHTGRGEQGVIQGKFGLSGKFKVQFEPPGLGQQGGEQQQQQRTAADNALVLRYKRFLHDADKHRIRQ